MADRLSIGTQYKDLIEDFDKVDLLNMKTSGERADIFMIALALGVNCNLTSKLQKVKKTKKAEINL